MLIPLTDFVWSMIQITLLVSAVLTISSLMRGRYPQWTSAMLGGAGLAALLLMILSGLPISHWSLASLNSATVVETEQVLSKHVNTDSKNNAISEPRIADDTSNKVADAIVAEEGSPDFPSIRVDENAPQQSWLGSTSHWLSIRLQTVDHRLRDFEAAQSKRASTILIVKTIVGLTVLLAAALWLHSWIWIRSVVCRSSRVNDENLRARVEQLAARLHIVRLPQLLESDRVAVGATVGMLRRRLILNSSWKSWSDDELEAVLLHELAHMLRHDYAWVIVTSWTRAVLFYHPLVHCLVRRLRMEQELAADQLAAGAMQNARAYGRALARLALRAECVAKVPSPVLTAEQVCIVRRITMLKQGSLKPLKKRPRQLGAMVALTIACAVPLSGLRGTPPEKRESASAAAEATVENVDEKELSPAEVELLMQSPGSKTAEEKEQIRREIKLTREQFPPVTFTGRLKWKPGNLNEQNAPPNLLYLQDIAAFGLFETVAEQAELNAPATLSLAWQTRARDREMLSVGAMFDESGGLDPGTILRCITNPVLGNFRRTSETKTIAGKQAVRIVAGDKDSASPVAVTSSESSFWFIADDDKAYFGSEEELINKLSRHGTEAITKQKLIHVPDQFAEQFASSAIALVYDDCCTWPERLASHFKGSKHQHELLLIAPYIKDLERIGVFLDATASDPNSSLPLFIRIGYRNNEAARNGAEGIEALVALAKGSKDDPLLSELLRTMKIEVRQDEVVLRFNDWRIPELLNVAFPQEFTGWDSVFGVVQAAEKTENGKSGTVQLACDSVFGSTGLLAQSVDASQYRGKRVRVSAEFGCLPEQHDLTGTLIWGGDRQFRTVGNASSGQSIGAPITTARVFQTIKSAFSEEAVSWKAETVEWNVPAETDVLSFGVYLAGGKALVRNMKFEVIGDATSDQAEKQFQSLPRNLLQIPGRQPLAQPSNLDFSQRRLDSSVEPESTQTAIRSEGNSQGAIRR